MIPIRKVGTVMSLSEFIRAKRLEKDLSQRDLATAAGLSNAEISRIESGKRKSPSPAILKVIAKALNVTLDEIYEQAGIIEKGQKFTDKFLEDHGDTPISEIMSSSSQQMMPSDLTEDELQEVMRYIDFIRSKRK